MPGRHLLLDSLGQPCNWCPCVDPGTSASAEQHSQRHPDKTCPITSRLCLRPSENSPFLSAQKTKSLQWPARFHTISPSNTSLSCLLRPPPGLISSLQPHELLEVPRPSHTGTSCLEALHLLFPWPEFAWPADSHVAHFFTSFRSWLKCHLLPEASADHLFKMTNPLHDPSSPSSFSPWHLPPSYMSIFSYSFFF